MQLDGLTTRVIVSIVVLAGLLNIPAPALSQEEANIHNLIVNGGFEAGFQEEYQLALGWGGFSNGNAVVGFQDEAWDQVVVAGEHAQMIEIKDAMELNRYAGIYQTVSVVPGEQYRLTIHGLIRSTEGDINLSDYGYRLQYAIDYNGGAAWELLDSDAWVELPWDEQPLADPPGGAYKIDEYETTITATSDKLTLFIRGWKKWANDGVGIFDLDEISLVGPAPPQFQIPAAEAAVVKDAAAVAASDAPATDALSPPAVQESPAEADSPATKQANTGDEAGDEAPPPAEDAPLPVSGYGKDTTVNYLVVSSTLLLLTLFVGAVTATMRQRTPADPTDNNLSEGGI